MKSLKNEKFDLQISEASSERSNPSNHHKIHTLGEVTSVSMSGVRVDLQRPVSGRCDVYSNGFSASQSAENSLLLENTLFLALGPYVCALNLPQLDLLWKSEVDPSLCFGIYYAPKHNVLIAHGEQAIACLSLDGILKWFYSGRDIFTTPDATASKTNITLLPDAIEVLDWNRDRYRISISNGVGSII